MTAASLFQHKQRKSAFAYMIFVAVCAWFGLITQFYITITTYSADRTLAGTLIQFFSYFTIICNLLAAVSITMLLFNPQSASGRYFSQPNILSAITFYMVIVALVYNTVLRPLATLHGLAFVANEILHVVTPLLYTAFWLALVPKGSLRWANALKWLWVPFIYLIYILIRGAISGLYPYPFMNVAKFGYLQIAFNSIVMLFVFLGLGMLFVFVARLLSKRQKA